MASTKTRWAAIVALAGVGCFFGALLALHWIQPGLSVLNDAMSYYVHGRHGWLLTVGLLGLGVGSASLTWGIWNAVRGPGSHAGRVGLLVWSVGVLLGGMFAADPPGNWNQPPSPSGAIHGIAALVALFILPVAGLCLSRSFRTDPRWQPFHKVSLILSLIAAMALVAFMLSVVPVMVRPGPPVLLGLTERFLMAAEASWLAVVAFGLLRYSAEADSAAGSV